MTELYGLTHEEVQALPLAVYVRYVITRSQGLWNSERIKGVLDTRGWTTPSSCPRNFAGNMLSRLEGQGAAVKVRRGQYEVFPEEVHKIQLKCLPRFQASVPPELLAKVTSWSVERTPLRWG